MLFAYLMLILPLALAWPISLRGRNAEVLRLGGIIGASLCFVAFGVLHFVAAGTVMQMLPSWMPVRLELVYATGALEILLGTALLVPRLRRAAGWGCVLALLAFFPANIYSWLNGVDIPGHGSAVEFFLVRMNYQILLIAWIWWFAIRER